MHVGRVVGYALLGLVDAFSPAVAVTYVASYAAETWATAAYAGMVALAVGVVLGAASAARGGRPFPLARGVKRLLDRFWWV